MDTQNTTVDPFELFVRFDSIEELASIIINGTSSEKETAVLCHAIQEFCLSGKSLCDQMKNDPTEATEPTAA